MGKGPKLVPITLRSQSISLLDSGQLLILRILPRLVVIVVVVICSTLVYFYHMQTLCHRPILA
jgi:hypothetical protein